jgi:hypothetical protein
MFHSITKPQLPTYTFEDTLLQQLAQISLCVPLETALVKTSINAKSNVGWDMLPERLNILAINGLHATQGSSEDISIEGEEVLGDLIDTRVYIIESSDKHSILAIRVELLMDGALGENRHLECVHGVGDWLGAILDDKVGDEAALDDNVKLCCSVVDVGGVHSTWTKESNCHGSTVADKSGHGQGGSGD